MVTSGKSIREKLPKVPYVHALDVWLLACTGEFFRAVQQYNIFQVQNNYAKGDVAKRREMQNCLRITFPSFKMFLHFDHDWNRWNLLSIHLLCARWVRNRELHLQPRQENSPGRTATRWFLCLALFIGILQSFWGRLPYHSSINIRIEGIYFQNICRFISPIRCFVTEKLSLKRKH